MIKTIKKVGFGIMAVMLMLPTISASAQDRSSIAVLSVASNGLTLQSSSVSNLVRLELEKTGTYKVMDKYDMNDLIASDSVEYSQCFGKTCLVKVGKKLKVGKMLTGSLEKFGNKITIVLRLVNVQTNLVEKTDIMEYSDIQDELQRMIGISVNNILGIENDLNTVNILVHQKSVINVPHKVLKLNGPRLGIAYITGYLGSRLTDPITEGGHGGYPVLTQFGYQFETQYMTTGNFQALIEFAPMVSGLDQGIFIPSLSFLNGFRENKHGWEVAFGPVLSMRRMTKGYFTVDEKTLESEWHLLSEWDPNNGTLAANGLTVVEGIDTRGPQSIVAGWIWSVGKTFKSGYLNIPVNVYVAPSKAGWYAGVSVGFNMAARNN